MSSFLIWDEEASARFPNMLLCTGVIRGAKVEPTNAQVKTLRRTVTEEVRGKHKLELLKDNPTVRAYRNLFWSLDIDPTKTRPSAKPCSDGCCMIRRFLEFLRLWIRIISLL